MITNSFHDFITLGDFETAAQRLISPMASEYLECGVGDELTLARNRSAFNDLRLNPRVLVDVSEIDTSIKLLGDKLASPILLAPVGYQKHFHPNGEIETVRGANLSKAQLVAASFSTVRFEDMAAESTIPLWFQLYVQHKREDTKKLLETVLEAGCRCVCVTVDVPVNGPRDREARAGFELPSGATRANFDFLSSDVARAPHRPTGTNIYNGLRSPRATWAEIEWIRETTSIPLMLKGVINPEDARLAVECGCDGVIVSNHGGRSLDTLPSTLEALPYVKDVLPSHVPVLMDGGIRRGTDVFKAIALGASAVLIGRPYIHGLAVAGAEGVAKVVSLLQTEFEMTMGLTGCKRVQQITRKHIWASSS